jgi:hypothetical protein
MEDSIQVWLLVLTLFLPRLSLFIAYFIHQIPANTIPFIADILMWLFIPRVLMLIYIADHFGTGSAWFWIHLITALAVWVKSSHVAYKKKKRKELI